MAVSILQSANSVRLPSGLEFTTGSANRGRDCHPAGIRQGSTALFRKPPGANDLPFTHSLVVMALGQTTLLAGNRLDSGILIQCRANRTGSWRTVQERPR